MLIKIAIFLGCVVLAYLAAAAVVGFAGWCCDAIHEKKTGHIDHKIGSVFSWNGIEIYAIIGLLWLPIGGVFIKDFFEKMLAKNAKK